MKKQYDYYETFSFKYNIDLYHDCGYTFELKMYRGDRDV